MQLQLVGTVPVVRVHALDWKPTADISIPSGRSTQIAVVQARLGRVTAACPERPDDVLMGYGRLLIL